MAKRVRLLAFDTSASACSIALLDTTKPSSHDIVTIHQIMPRQQAHFILPLINELLKKQGTAITDLDGIAFGCGPGSFTGIRIAASVAQGLAFVARCPVMPVSSLAALAQTAYQLQGWPAVLAAVDARMNEIYWGAYRVNSSTGLMTLVGTEGVYSPEKISIFSKEDWYGAGDGWGIYREKIEKQCGFKLIHAQTDLLPKAEAILSLARAKFEQKDWVNAFDAVPIYLR